MKKTLMIKMVRKEIRRALNPTGLMGKRGPAKSVPVLVSRAIEAKSSETAVEDRPSRGSAGFYWLGGSK